MKYKLLVMDVDGTLVDKEGNISTDDKEAIARARQLGIQISLSTGRAAQACLGILDQLSLDGYHVFFDGALVIEPRQGREIYVQPIDSAVAKEAIEFARQNDIYLEFFSATHYFTEYESRFSEIRRSFFGIEPTVVDFTDLWQQERFTKAQLMVSSPKEAAKAQKFYAHFDGRLRFSLSRTPAYPDIDFVNVIDPRVSKGKALEALTSHLGIALDEVMAVGDGNNDIPLLTTAGLAVAMGDAPDEVKAVADYVTLDIDHNGLETAIEKFLL